LSDLVATTRSRPRNERSPEPVRRVPAWVLWLGGTALLGIAIWVPDMASGPNLAEAPWFIELLHRVSAGDALYEDQFYGVMPLAVWVGLPAVLVFGVQISVLKALDALLYAAGAVFAIAAAKRLGVGVAGQVLVGIASVVYLVLPSSTPYAQMAYAAQVGALAAIATWLRADPGRSATAALILAGSAAGVSIASKQTVGALTLAASIAVVVAARAGKDGSSRARLRDAGVLAAPAVVIPALTLLPVAIAGDLGAFWRYAIDKGPYLEHGSVSYLEPFRALGDTWGVPPANPDIFLRQLGILAAPAALLGLAVTVRRGGEWLLLAAFTTAAVASSYPRLNLPSAIPISSVAIAWSARQLAGSRLRELPARMALAAIGLLLLTTAYGTLVLPVRAAIRDGYATSHVEHFDGVMVRPSFDHVAATVGAGLSTADAGQNRTFVLSPSSGFDYLVSGLRNPTRHGFPFASTFRDGDVAELERQIESGQILRVCLRDYGLDPLAPAMLEDWVRSRLSKGERVGPRADTPFGYLGCTIYRSPVAD
jgi:hypothetical protein